MKPSLGNGWGYGIVLLAVSPMFPLTTHTNLERLGNPSHPLADEVIFTWEGNAQPISPRLWKKIYDTDAMMKHLSFKYGQLIKYQDPVRAIISWSTGHSTLVGV